MTAIALRAPRSLDTTTRTAEAQRCARSAGRPATRGVYWRRRIVALAVMAGVLAMVRPAAGAISGAGNSGTASVDAPAHHIVVKTYVVQPGDSLWTAARHMAPQTDPRKVVQALEQARHGRTLLPGEVITWAP